MQDLPRLQHHVSQELQLGVTPVVHCSASRQVMVSVSTKLVRNMRLEAFLSLVSNINKSSIVLIYLNILFIENVHIHGRTEGGGEVQGG